MRFSLFFVKTKERYLKSVKVGTFYSVTKILVVETKTQVGADFQFGIWMVLDRTRGSWSFHERNLIIFKISDFNQFMHKTKNLDACIVHGSTHGLRFLSFAVADFCRLEWSIVHFWNFTQIFSKKC